MYDDWWLPGWLAEASMCVCMPSTDFEIATGEQTDRRTGDRRQLARRRSKAANGSN